jgi:hypothetical protein
MKQELAVTGQVFARRAKFVQIAFTSLRHGRLSPKSPGIRANAPPAGP